jgi:hypothetical protein
MESGILLGRRKRPVRPQSGIFLGDLFTPHENKKGYSDRTPEPHFGHHLGFDRGPMLMLLDSVAWPGQNVPSRPRLRVMVGFA